MLLLRWVLDKEKGLALKGGGGGGGGEMATEEKYPSELRLLVPACREMGDNGSFGALVVLITVFLYPCIYRNVLSLIREAVGQGIALAVREGRDEKRVGWCFFLLFAFFSFYSFSSLFYELATE